MNAECDDFPCFEINTKFDEDLLFDLVEKYENESSKMKKQMIILLKKWKKIH